MKALMKPVLPFALLMLAACGGDKEAAEPDPLEGISRDAALDLISVDDLKAHVEFLADDKLEGRLTGEPGHQAAADYVVEHFESLGLEPGGEEGWFQQVPLQTFLIDVDSTQFVQHRDMIDSAFKFRDDYTMSGDKVRPENFIRAEVVYAGYGVHAPEFGYSDYEGIDVEGKVVAIFGGAPEILGFNERAYYASGRTKAAEAIKRGAIGFIGLRSRKSQDSYPWERVRKSAGKKPGMAWLSLAGDASDHHDEIQSTVYMSAKAATEMFEGSPISFEEALDKTEASEPASVPLGFEVTIARKTIHDQITSPNVIGIVRGTDPELKDEYVVYTGHLDHIGVGVPVDGDAIYNGMYDNAMGIGLLLEAAKTFAANPPRRSIMFIALTGEERGLLGSDYFAHYPTVPIESIVANVNLDMPLFIYPTADLIAFGSQHSTLEQIVDAAIATEDFTLSPDPMPEEVLFIRSDQYSFVRKGVPSTYLIPGLTSTDKDIDTATLFQEHLKKHYHQPSDDLSRPVDWPSAERFARANTLIGYAIADADGRPQWKDGDFFGQKFGRKDGVAEGSAGSSR